MTSIVVPRVKRPAPIPAESVPPLHNGDRLTRAEFLRRYDATPPGVKAELIEGVVYMPSPVGQGHGDSHVHTGTILGTYEASTPGVRASDNATVILGERSVPQPDLHLRVLPGYGGRVGLSEGGLLVGPPELVIEVSHSSESIDLHDKRGAYARAGVVEYLVLLVRERGLRAFNLSTGADRPIDQDGIYRSEVFPGLWIDPAALLSGNIRRAIQVLNKGLKSREHAAFVRRLRAAANAGRRNPPPRPRRRK